MVFSVNTIKSTMNQSIVESNSSISEFHSFFIESLELISEEQNIFRSLITQSVQEQESVNEGLIGGVLLIALLAKMNPKQILIKILDGFIDLLDKLWKNFYAFMLDFCGKKNVIHHYKKQLETINSAVYYSEDRYVYTNLGTSTSYTTFKNDLDKEFSNLILDISKFRDYRTYEGLVTEIEAIRQQIDMTDSYFDSVRGNVVGSYNPVSKEDFVKELFNFFRNNGNVILGDKYIMPAEIRVACDGFFNFKKSLKQIQKDKIDLQDTSKSLQKQIKAIKFEDYVKDSIPEQAQKMFINVLESKASRINQLCTIYTQVFSMKLDTVKESYTQYSKMLMAACKTIVKERNKQWK